MFTGDSFQIPAEPVEIPAHILTGGASRDHRLRRLRQFLRKVSPSDTSRSLTWRR